MKHRLIYFLIIFLGIQCRQTYLPPVTQKNYSYLVVDGFIANGSDSTIIKLSRTTPISDSIFSVPEVGAQVTVIGDQSDIYFLADGGNGSYYIPSLVLNSSEKYTLRIITTNGNVYESNPLEVKASPPIDSVSWDQLTPGIVNIYVTTHDPQNNTRYYRWDYTETWQYGAKFQSTLEYTSNGLVMRPPADQISTCWRSRNSPNILINSSEKLADDVIFKNQLLQITGPDDRLDKKYSILVKQYAIDKNAFNYYQQLQNNSENLGSIFGPTPSQLNGNIHNVNDASERVIGYINAGSISQQRIFIDYLQVDSWPLPNYPPNCQELSIGLNDVDFYFSQGSYIPIAENVVNLVLIGIWAAYPECVDCRLQGGTTTKPPFWP